LAIPYHVTFAVTSISAPRGARDRPLGSKKVNKVSLETLLTTT